MEQELKRIEWNGPGIKWNRMKWDRMKLNVQSRNECNYQNESNVTDQNGMVQNNRSYS